MDTEDRTMEAEIMAARNRIAAAREKQLIDAIAELKRLTKELEAEEETVHLCIKKLKERDAEIERLTRERDSARISSGLHLEQETGWRDLANERYDKTRELERERDALRAAHEQIKTVC